jgi:hypothetical protein
VQIRTAMESTQECREIQPVEDFVSCACRCSETPSETRTATPEAAARSPQRAQGNFSLRSFNWGRVLIPAAAADLRKCQVPLGPPISPPAFQQIILPGVDTRTAGKKFGFSSTTPFFTLHRLMAFRSTFLQPSR